MAGIYLPGKFGRFQRNGQAVQGAYRWAPGFRRERLDTTNFESAVSGNGVNVHSEGETGVLDTTFTVEGNIPAAAPNLFWPDVELTCDLLFRKTATLGYRGIKADVLEFNPTLAVRELGKFTCQMQANGLVNPAS